MTKRKGRTSPEKDPRFNSQVGDKAYQGRIFDTYEKENLCVGRNGSGGRTKTVTVSSLSDTNGGGGKSSPKKKRTKYSPCASNDQRVKVNAQKAKEVFGSTLTES